MADEAPPRTTVRDLIAPGRVAEAKYLYGRLLALARQQGLGQAAAEDLAQQAVVQALLRADQYTPQTGRPFLAWLLAIARNLAVDELRRVAAERRALERVHALPRETSVTADGALHDEQAARNRQRLLASLAPEEREFYRTWTQQHARLIDRATAAARLGLSIEAYEAGKKRLDTRLHKALMQLGLRLEDLSSATRPTILAAASGSEEAGE